MKLPKSLGARDGGSRLTRLSLLVAAPRDGGARTGRLGLVILPVLLLGLVLTVREIARVERVLAADGTRAQRVVTYVLPRGGVLRAPIERGSDVVRVVVHAVRRGGALGPAAHVARLSIRARGVRGEAVEDVALPLPGTATRVTPEEPGVSVGDPLAFNLDLHGVGEGELTLSLLGLDDADAVAVRLYRRDALGEEAEVRAARLAPGERRHLALRAGELGFLDVDPEEQRALIGARWRKLSARRDGDDAPRTLAIALATPPERAAARGALPADAWLDLRGDERGAWIAQGPASLVFTAEGDASAEIRATLIDADGDSHTRSGRGAVRVDVEPSRRVAIEIERGAPGEVSLRASSPAALAPDGFAVAYRVRPERALRVDAATLSRILRLTARKPLPRGSREPAQIALEATLTLEGGRSERVPLRATRAASRYDRYVGRSDPRARAGTEAARDEADPRDDPAGEDGRVEAPTERAVFHVILPAHASLSVTAAEGPVDLSLSELDPASPPQPAAAFPADAPHRALRETGGPGWPGYVPRRPSNADAFGPDARRLIRTPPRLVEVAFPPPAAPTFRLDRPNVWDALVLAKRIFEPSTVAYEIELPPGEGLVLPLRLYTTEPLSVVARVDGARPWPAPAAPPPAPGATIADATARRDAGFPARVTTARTFSVDREVRTVMVLGDDLAPGKHVLTFTPPPGKKAWVHLPWTIHARPPGPTPPDPRWIDGELDD